MKNIQRILLLVISGLLFSSLAFAEPQKWDMDKAHSSIYFDIKHIYATVRGGFTDFSGLVVFDPENKETGSVEFEVKVDSVNTGINKRDDHLRSEDFFDIGKYPLMSFKSTGVKRLSDDQYALEGDLTLKDVTKKVSIPFAFLGLRENPLRAGSYVAGFEADFTLDRLEYHVGTGKFYDMGVLGKDVRIVVSLEVMKDK
ncbi:MAG: YceI family protein [Proteobacteria bacterium]|nr:YceI family protein [Pseudomonadota bacterium]MBU4469054.1 YceI family protein [Pseudomonadota bacterium]MCG2751026.1 YceI family protein [Desulfobacteraceae bacterium]